MPRSITNRQPASESTTGSGAIPVERTMLMATATIPTDHSITTAAVYITAPQLAYFANQAYEVNVDLVITATDGHGGLRVERATDIDDPDAGVWVDALGVERQTGSGGLWASSTIASWVLARLERLRAAGARS